MNSRKPAANRLKTKPAASKPERGPRRRLSFASWRDQHFYSLFSSLGRMAAKPWATALTAFVMGLALALPLLFLMLLTNAQGLAQGWQDAREITVFLKPAVDEQHAEALAASLRARADVASVSRRSPEQGLAEFRQMSGFSQALDVLEANPLPQVLIVTPKDGVGEAEPGALAPLKADANVDLVQYDATWRRRLGAILTLATRAGQVLAVLLSLGALLVVGNTVRLDIQARRDEIGVLQLVGASNGFVRRPFLYSGLWLGLVAGIVALVVVLGSQLALAAPVERLLESYEHRFVLKGLPLPLVACVPLASAALGWLGAMLATARHLAEGNPQ